jgi:hypothetical protein
MWLRLETEKLMFSDDLDRTGFSMERLKHNSTLKFDY